MNSLRYFLFLYIFLFFSGVAAAQENVVTQTNISEEERQNRFPLIPKEIWDQVYPYLIPLDHEAKPILDKIFKKSKVLSSLEAFEAAGFEIIQYRRTKKIAVARHPKLKNYVIKAYLDDNHQREWTLWIHRIEGSIFVQSVIDKNNYHHLYKVPKKWIYAVSRKPSEKNKSNPYLKNFVLVVQDMKLLDKEAHLKKLQTEMSYSQLKTLFKMLSEIGYCDCHADNIPFSKDGRIAFIDLEYYKIWPVRFKSLTRSLSPSRQEYWKKLTNESP